MIGKQIYETRKIKGLSQEALAEEAKINVRTLQCIENGQNEPSGKTLQLLCNALQLDISELEHGAVRPVVFKASAIDFGFLILWNLLIVLVYGFLTLDSNATLNSKVAAVLLGFLLPYFIISKTLQLSGAQRLVKYGSGLLLYLILVAVKVRFPPALLLGFYPSILIALCLLYYGNSIMGVGKLERQP